MKKIMENAVAKFEKAFINTGAFEKIKINGITNYYQSNYLNEDGTIHFYRIDVLQSQGIIIETAVNFQDAIRDVYEDSDCLDFDIDDNEVQKIINTYYINKNCDYNSSFTTDLQVLSSYCKLVDLFKDLSLFKEKHIKQKQYFLCGDKYYRINFDYDKGFILEVAYGFEKADAHIHEILAIYPQIIRHEDILSIRNKLLSQISN